LPCGGILPLSPRIPQLWTHLPFTEGLNTRFRVSPLYHKSGVYVKSVGSSLGQTKGATARWGVKRRLFYTFNRRHID